MLDFDLAELYQVPTKVLKQSIKRNLKRFPHDFMFTLTREEYNSLRSQIVTLENSGRGKYSKYLPYAFTEQGVAMLSGILNSDIAIEVNISIMRAFVFMRQYALSHKDLTTQLKKMEKKYNRQFKDIYQAIEYLIRKDKQQKEQTERKLIGFKKG